MYIRATCVSAYMQMDLKAVALQVQEALSRVSGDPAIELEFRLGVVRGGRFDPAIHPDLFNNITSGLNSNPRWKSVTQTRVVDHVFYNGTRCSLRDDTWSTIVKKKLLNIDVPIQGSPFTARIALATEEAMQLTTPPAKGHAPIVRDKRRTSYEHKFWRYDATTVKQIKAGNRDDDRDTLYEVEVELIDQMQIVGKPIDYIEYILGYGLALCNDVVKLSKVSM